MEYLYNVKDTKTEMYYSDDKAFIEPEKKFAKRMRAGQAKFIALYKNRSCKEVRRYILEKAE